MSFGQNLYNFFMEQAQPIVIILLMCVGLFLLWQKKLTELIAFCIVAVIAVGLVWNPYGAKDALLNVFNSVFGVSGGTAAGVLPMLQPHLLPDAVLYLLC